MVSVIADEDIAGVPVVRPVLVGHRVNRSIRGVDVKSG